LGQGDGRYSFDLTLKSIGQFADVYVQENYQRESSPRFDAFELMTKNIDRASPGLMKKTIFALLIAQTPPYNADDNPNLEFSEFLEAQIRSIKSGQLSGQTPGIAYWVFYRSQPETIQSVVQLTAKYFVSLNPPAHR